MGAFILVSKSNNNITGQDIKNLMLEKGFRNPLEIQFEDFLVYQYDKIHSEESFYRTKNNCHFFFSGTPVYRNAENIEQSLNNIVDSILSNQFDFNNIRGSFSIIYSNANGNLFLLTDQAGINNIYYNTDYSVFSNLFLAAIFATPGKLTLNKMAAIEVIISGRQIGPDTLLNEIKRYEVFVDNGSLGTVSIINDPELLAIPVISAVSFNKQVDNQLEKLDAYFNDITPFAENYGVDSGLTAGHDSRMMLMLLLRHIQNFSIHSLWRKKDDLELGIAKEIARAIKLDLKVVTAKHHYDKSNEEMTQNLKNALLFYDGHIRMHCFLTEEYNTAGHRINILGNKRLGMNGNGGEQYRNDEHMEFNRWSMSYFIKYFLGYHLCGKAFTDNSYENDFFNYLKNKVVKRLALNPQSKTISRFDVKRYMNEIYVSSLMGARTNAENQLSHFLTPYTDRRLTITAYEALPNLGISFSFQQAMLRKLNPELANIISGYGYNFTKGEPVKNKIKYLVKAVTPKNIYQSKLDKILDKKGNADFTLFLKQFPILQRSVEALRDYSLPLSEIKITSAPDLMPVYLSLGYFIHYLNTRNKL